MLLPFVVSAVERAGGDASEVNLENLDATIDSKTRRPRFAQGALQILFSHSAHVIMIY